MSNYKTMAKRPNGKEFEPVTMLDNHFGNHRYGVEFQDGKIYKESKCEIMKSQKEDLNDETKSPLDEFIEERGSLFYEEFSDYDGSNIEPSFKEISDCGPVAQFLRESILLAVQKHAESVIPDVTEHRKMAHDPNNGQCDFVRNITIHEIKSASDKWRGV